LPRRARISRRRVPRPGRVLMCPHHQLSERARLRELEREVRELRMKNKFLSKVAAYFAAEHR